MATASRAPHPGLAATYIVATDLPDIEAVVDPPERPMSAHIAPKQAKDVVPSLARGEPDRMTIAMATMREQTREMV